LPEWLEIYLSQEKRITCLFGEHLLSRYPNNPVALVEAPKTAVYCTLYCGLPETPENFIWLAVYNKSSFSFDKLKVLQGRFVSVFPDLSKEGNTFKEWETKAKEYESRLSGTRFIFSDLLERSASEADRSEGNDLADFLIKKDWRLFRKRESMGQPPQSEPEKVTKVTKVTHEKKIIFSENGIFQPGFDFGEWLQQEDDDPLPNEMEAIQYKPDLKSEFWNRKKKQPENWSSEIADLETYFASVELPTQPVKLNRWTTITACSLFIESHLCTVKGNNGNETFLPYLERLQELKKVLIIN